MKNVKIIKTMLIIMLMVLLSNNISNGSFVIDKAELYGAGDCGVLLKYKGVNVKTTYVVYKSIDGKEYPSYCLNRTLPGVGELGDYAVTTNNDIKDMKIYRAVINAYPYKTIEELGCANKFEAYTASKQAIYCILYDRFDAEMNDYEGVGEAGIRTLNAMKKIVSDARNSSEIKNSSKIEISSTSKDTWTAKGKTLTQEFKLSAKGSINSYIVNIDTNLDGVMILDKNGAEKKEFLSSENFTLSIPLLNKGVDKYINIGIEGKVNTLPVLYGVAPNSSMQDYAITGVKYEIGNGSKNLNVYNDFTKLEILKTDEESEIPIEGVKFDILDSNKNVVYANLTTDENGKILVENMMPGKYYIKEIEAPNEYSILESDLEIIIELNKPVNVKVKNNKKKDVKIETEVTTKEYEVVKLPKTGM